MAHTRYDNSARDDLVYEPTTLYNQGPYAIVAIQVHLSTTRSPRDHEKYSSMPEAFESGHNWCRTIDLLPYTSHTISLEHRSSSYQRHHL